MSAQSTINKCTRSCITLEGLVVSLPVSAQSVDEETTCSMMLGSLINAFGVVSHIFWGLKIYSIFWVKRSVMFSQVSIIDYNMDVQYKKEVSNQGYLLAYKLENGWHLGQLGCNHVCMPTSHNNHGKINLFYFSCTSMRLCMVALLLILMVDSKYIYIFDGVWP